MQRGLHGSASDVMCKNINPQYQHGVLLILGYLVALGIKVVKFGIKIISGPFITL